MFRVKVEAMPDNPAVKNIGDKSGLWRVAVYERVGESSYTEKLMNYHAENLTHEEAVSIASDLQARMNSR
jgi:hypothetical protein